MNKIKAIIICLISIIVLIIISLNALNCKYFFINFLQIFATGILYHNFEYK